VDSELDAKQGQPKELRSSLLSNRLLLRRREARLGLEPDSSVTYVESLSERRLVFGRESFNLHKLQAGVRVRSQKPDWKLSVSPYSAAYSARLFETVEIAQQIEFCDIRSMGFVRKVRLTNFGGTPMRILLTTLHDPTAAHYREDSWRWGSISLNGFNRTSHVALDEVAEPPSARIIGSTPAPKAIYMTTDRSRAEEVSQAAELPDSTAGMSGQILIVMLHEVDLPPQGSAEVSVVSLYNSGGLEDALADFRRAFDARTKLRSRLQVSCSSASLDVALHWLGPSLEGTEFTEDRLEKVESLPGLIFADHEAASRTIEAMVKDVRKDGLLPHSSVETQPGRLESALFLAHASLYSVLSGDKKLGRPLYRSLRKVAGALSENKSAGDLRPPSDVPQGWRRMLGKGCPSGTVPEVTLATAAALTATSALALQLGRPEDSAKLIEASELTVDHLRRIAVDDSGGLALYVDNGGSAHRDETIDQAMALYRHPFDKRVSSTVIHRLQESDFETGYGPRTVPTSNRVYFNGAYGEGQLGGFWPRAALAMATLAYAAGYPGLGSIQLQKIGRLASEDAARFRRAPGQIPVWVDVERKTSHGGSDPVSASRLLEAVVKGELGLTLGSRGIRVSPAVSSTLKWLMATGLWLGEDFCAFVGRAEGRAYTFAKCSKVVVDGGTRFSGSEEVQCATPELSACQFHGPGQVICVGSSSARVVHSAVRFGPKDPAVLNHLSVGVQELDSTKGSWNKTHSLRVSPLMTLEFSVDPGGWKAFRLSTD